MMLPRTVAYALEIAIERGDLAAAENLAHRYGDEMGRERIFGGPVSDRPGPRTCSRETRAADWRTCCAAASCSVRMRWPDPRPGGRRLRGRWPSSERRTRAVQLARDAVAVARGFGAPRTLAHSLRAAGTVIGGPEGLELLEEAVSAVDHSPARLEAAHALAELGAAMVKQRRRREGREVLRLALETAQACGANALVDRVRGEIGAGGGRRAAARGQRRRRPDARRTTRVRTSSGRSGQPRDCAAAVRHRENRGTPPHERLPQARGSGSRFQLSSVLPPAAQAG